MGCSQNSFIFAEPLPDGNGGLVPCPFVLTEIEAIRFLRLDRQKAKPENTLAHYRERGLLRATILGKNRFYTRRELISFVDILTPNKNEYKYHKRRTQQKKSLDRPLV
jgi:hypothetical protein